MTSHEGIEGLGDPWPEDVVAELIEDLANGRVEP